LKIGHIAADSGFGSMSRFYEAFGLPATSRRAITAAPAPERERTELGLLAE
jgi:hypothetical protein